MPAKPDLLLLSPEEGPAFWFTNCLVTLKASSASSGGAYSLFHQVAPPGYSTPLHQHRDEDEAFYLLEGEVTFFIGREKKTMGPGAYVYLPRGSTHGFRVEGEAPATMLLFTMPGHQFEGFVQAMGKPAHTRTLPVQAPLDIKRLTCVSSAYGVETVGPLPE